MAIRLIHVVCSCGAECNKVEYDPDGRAKRVQQISNVLGIDQAAAEAYIDQHNADPAAQAKTYAGSLLDDTVSPCPLGHVGQLQVRE